MRTTRIHVPLLLALLLGCSSTVGEGWPEQASQAPPPGDGGTHAAADTAPAAAADATSNDLGGDEIDLAVPSGSGCVACHTDKERLLALVPPGETEAAESGGG